MFIYKCKYFKTLQHVLLELECCMLQNIRQNQHLSVFKAYSAIYQTEQNLMVLDFIEITDIGT